MPFKGIRTSRAFSPKTAGFFRPTKSPAATRCPPPKSWSTSAASASRATATREPATCCPPMTPSSFAACPTRSRRQPQKSTPSASSIRFWAIGSKKGDSCRVGCAHRRRSVGGARDTPAIAVYNGFALEAKDQRMSADILIEEASKLSAADRLRIAEALWQSAWDEQAELPITPQQCQELDH